MSKIVLHIGTEKTGTTTLQSFLDINKKDLLHQGFFVPRFLAQRNNFWLPIMFYEKGHSDHITNKLKNKEDFIQKKFEIFREKINKGPSYTWIVSSEFLQSRLNVNEINNLANFIKSYFDHIQIILYIRPPLDTSISLWSTAIKAGAKNLSLPKPDQKYYQKICSHKNTIETWSHAFKYSEISVRLFDKSIFYNEDLIEDFCSAGYINHTSNLSLPSSKNKSLSFFGMLTLAKLNIFFDEQKYDKSIIAEKRKYIIDYLNYNYKNVGKYVPSLREADLYREFYKESDNFVVKNVDPRYEKLLEKSFSNSSDSKTYSDERLNRATKDLHEFIIKLC